MITFVGGSAFPLVCVVKSAFMLISIVLVITLDCRAAAPNHRAADQYCCHGSF